MDTTSTVWIAVLVIVALVAVALVFWNGRRQRDAHIRAQADELRERLRREDDEVRYRAWAAQTYARTRAAQRPNAL